MVALERRSSAPEASRLTSKKVARLGLIAAANVACLALLWRAVLSARAESASAPGTIASATPGASVSAADGAIVSAGNDAIVLAAPEATGNAARASESTAVPPPIRALDGATSDAARTANPPSTLLAANISSNSAPLSPDPEKPASGSPVAANGAPASVPLLTPPITARANSADLALEARLKKHIAEAEKLALDVAKDRMHPGEASVAINVRELGVRGDLVAIGADRSVRPASNMKLVTTAAALVLLGPDWAFQTVLDTAAPIANGHVQGDVIVRAAGDPLLDWNADGEVEGFVEKLAAGFAQKGVRSIDGALVLDEGDFQPPSPGPAWPSERERWEEFCALAGGFSANAGCITIVVHASQPGASAQVEVHPRWHGYAPKIAVQTVGAKEKLDVRVEVKNGALRIEGAIPKDVPQWTSRFAVPDPVELFGNALVGGLRARGIAVQGGWKRDRAVAGAPAVELARLRTPLSDTLVPINTHSNNACADQVFLAMGHAICGQGTRAGGRAATARALARLGVSADGFVQVDGSGLSRDNRVSARQIAALIDAVLRLDARTSKLFLDSLAVGAESGTLDGRMKKADLAGRVHAKTGFINGTGALSGLIETREGRRLVFSILVEYPNIEGLNKRCWKPMEDAICEELASWNG
jgi:PBP4 family serine-type D-alanyl-D-alanine carboxypeptidase